MYAVIVRVVVKWTSLLFSIVFGWSAQYVHIVQRKRIERSHFSCFYLFSIYLILDLSRLFFLCLLQQYCNVHGTQSLHMEKDRRPCEGVSERERDSKKKPIIWRRFCAETHLPTMKNCCSWLNNFHFSAFWIALLRSILHYHCRHWPVIVYYFYHFGIDDKNDFIRKKKHERESPMEGKKETRRLKS